MTTRNWTWLLSSTMNKKAFYPMGEGYIDFHLKNTGRVKIHVYQIGIEFEWQKRLDRWFPSDCDIVLDPGEDADLGRVEFSIPVDLKPGKQSYRLGVRMSSLQMSGWQKHNIVRAVRGKGHDIKINKHPSRNYLIFVSHSNDQFDMKVVNALEDILDNNGIDIYIAEKRPKYGELLWVKIRRNLLKADRTIIIWTKSSSESGDVREEIGIATGARKKIIPVLEKDIPPKGSLIGVEAIPIRLERNNYLPPLKKLAEEVVEEAEEKSKRKKQRKGSIKKE